MKKKTLRLHQTSELPKITALRIISTIAYWFLRFNKIHAKPQCLGKQGKCQKSIFLQERFQTLSMEYWVFFISLSSWCTFLLIPQKTNYYQRKHNSLPNLTVLPNTQVVTHTKTELSKFWKFDMPPKNAADSHLQQIFGSKRANRIDQKHFINHLTDCRSCHVNISLVIEQFWQ